MIQDTSIKMDYIKLDFNMIWLMGILKIYLEGQFLIKYYIIKSLILLNITNMMRIQKFLLQQFLNLLVKSYKFATHTGQEINAEKQQLFEELHKPIIEKLKKRQVYSCG